MAQHSAAPWSALLGEAPINRLPLDLLEQLVFRHFRLREILSVVSLVCWHWRRVSLRFVTALFDVRAHHLNAPSMQRFLDMASRVSSVWLTFQAMDEPPRALAFPPSVTSLRLFLGNSHPIDALVFRALRHLRIDDIEGAHQLAALSVHFPTLESLHINHVCFLSPEIRTLAKARLPSLSSLTCKDGCSRTLLPFIAAHASQLTALVIDLHMTGFAGTSLEDLATIPSLPRLESMSLSQRGDSTDAAAQLTRILHNAPALRELHVLGLNGVLKVPLTLLTSLASIHAGITPTEARVLEALPRLRSVQIRDTLPSSSLLAYPDAALARLPQLEVTIGDEQPALLSKARNVTHLTLLWVRPNITLAYTVRLPALKSIAMEARASMVLSYNTLANAMRTCRIIAPHFNMLTIDFRWLQLRDSYTLFCEAALDLTQRGGSLQLWGLPTDAAEALRARCTLWDDVRITELKS